LGTVKKKSQDFFKGGITCKGIPCGEIYGNYMGFFEIDGKRYWDIRSNNTLHHKIVPIGNRSLQSDSTWRRDSEILKTGDYNQA